MYEDSEEVIVEEIPKEVTEHTLYSWDKFIYPIGDIVNAMDSVTHEQYWRSGLWWCPPEKWEEVKCKCLAWEKHGFILLRGVDSMDNGFYTQVIENELLQHGRNLRYCWSYKEVPALIGDFMVWFEIHNPDKALEYLQEYTDIPVAVLCDWDKYITDDVYKNAFDTANKYFIQYYLTGKPINLHPTETDIIETE